MFHCVDEPQEIAIQDCSTPYSTTNRSKSSTVSWYLAITFLLGIVSAGSPAEISQSGIQVSIPLRIQEKPDESQRIAGQAYSHAYNTPFKSSRLQGIPVGHTVPFHSSAAPRPTSGPQRVQHPSHDPDTPEDASIAKSNHAADYISSIYSARLPA
jgi:hypothetical protein